MKAVKKYLCIFFAFLIMTGFGIMACNNVSDGYTDAIGPSHVTELEAVGSDGTVTLTWTDPSDTDFDHILIKYGNESVTVASGIETYEVTGLTNEEGVQFKVYSVDKHGNISTVKQTGGIPTKYSGGWILAYFKSNSDGTADYESLHFGYSADGLNYTAINSGSAVFTIDSATGSGNTCVRDCYVNRIQDDDASDTESHFIYMATDWTPYGSSSYSNTTYGTTGATSYWNTISPCLIMADVTVDTSDNTVTFSDQRCVRMVTLSDSALSARSSTQMHAWAPELIQDAEGNAIYTDGTTSYKYGVIWSGDGDLDGNDFINRTYINYTNDFTTFTDPQLYFECTDVADSDSDGNTSEAVTEIDATVSPKVDGMYYMFYKGEASGAKDIQEADSSSLAPETFSIMHDGEYISRTTSQSTGVYVEGPLIVNSNGTWWMFADHYGSTSVTSTANFYGFSSSDISAAPSNWTKHANDGDYSFPAGVRHATAFRVTTDELTAFLNTAW
ncbi:MAG TPA: hypothetical protein DCL73_06160 [Treponema sp.]|nr:hypothetical protein [Treponema sp.]